MFAFYTVESRATHDGDVISLGSFRAKSSTSAILQAAQILEREFKRVCEIRIKPIEVSA